MDSSDVGMQLWAVSGLTGNQQARRRRLTESLVRWIKVAEGCVPWVAAVVLLGELPLLNLGLLRLFGFYLSLKTGVQLSRI